FDAAVERAGALGAPILEGSKVNPVARYCEIWIRDPEGYVVVLAGAHVDSWVDLDYFRCFQLMRTDDRTLFDVWMTAWNDLAHFEIIPVRTSAEAARHVA